MAGPIAIAVIADVAKARAGLNAVEGDLSGLGGKTSKFGTIAKAGFLAAGAAAATFAVSAVKSASDSQQSLGATETVFGKFANAVIKDSKSAAQAYGLSANEYRENANLIGSLFKNQGVAMSELGGKTETMIGQAADLAATFGGTTKDAVEALGSAFKGEFDPLEKYGISIKQSTINAELAARGQDKLTGAALKQAQQIATTDLIMKQAASTQGAFARESNTLAGQQQRLGAQWENIKATIGSALLPVLTSLAATFNEVVLPAISSAWSWLQEKLGPAFATAKAYVQQLTDTFGGKGGGLAAAVATVKEIFGQVVAVVGPIVQQLVGLVRDNWSKIVGWTKDTFGQIRSTVKSQLELVRTVVSTVLSIVKTLWNRFGDDILRIIKTAWTTIGAVIKAALNIIQGVIRTVTAVIKGDWTGAWNGIKQILSGAWDAIKAIVKGALSIVGTIVRAGFNLLKDAASAGIRKLIGAVKAIPGQVKSGLGALGSLLFSAGQDLIRGLINGVKNMAGSLVNAAKDVVGGAIDGAKALLGIASPSKVFAEIGKFVGQGFVKGLVGTRDEVSGTMRDLAQLVQDANRDALDQALADSRPRLLALATEYDKLRGKLDTLRDSFRDYSASVRDSVVALGSVTGFEAEDGSTSFDSIVSGLKDAKRQAREWHAVLRDLDRMGLNKTALDQLASQGPEQGLAAALAIAEEGKRGVREINKLQGQIADLAAKAGKTAADALFREGKQVGSAIINGLERGIDRIEIRMEGVATRLAAKIQAAMNVDVPKLDQPKPKDDDLADEIRKTRQAIEKLPNKYRVNERTNKR